MSVGFDTGVAINKMQYNIPNSVNSLVNSIGYTANLAFQYKINRFLLLGADLGQLEKNYISNNNQDIYLKVQNTYLQFSINGSYLLNFTNKFYGSVSCGFYSAYWSKSRNEGLVPNAYNVTEGFDPGSVEQIGLEKIRSVHKFDSQIDNRLEFGWLCGAGVNYVLTGNIKLSLKGQLFEALTGQEKIYYENQVRKYNQTLAFTFGVIYGF
ncbi:MAG: hypothetical protein WAM41_17890 [Psychrobacillus psychrotolerans]|uniref:hypothetical protein n=1 Tax=Psychrobacillus psychrotolerans TaxID=126156 RepID=UPI003BB0291D